MKKLLGILVLGLLWCNVVIAGEREPGNDEIMSKSCYLKGKKAFDDSAKVYVNEELGVTTMYFGCNKSVTEWDWYFSREVDVNTSHQKAYKRCV